MSKQRVNALIDGEIGGKDAIDLPEVTDGVLGRVLGDPALLETYVRETIRPIIYNAVIERVQQTRRNLVVVGTIAATRQRVRSRVSLAARIARWESWYEHSGSASIRLTMMKRPELIRAAEEREDRGNRELRIAGLMREIAGRLPDDTTPVGQRLTLAEIDAIATSLGIVPEVDDTAVGATA